MNQSGAVNNRQQDILNAKITRLRRNAFVLFKKMKELEMPPLTDISRGIDLSDELRRFEIYLIRRALEETGGRQTQAARLLGLKLTTLHSKIKRYGIDPHNLSP